MIYSITQMPVYQYFYFVLLVYCNRFFSAHAEGSCCFRDVLSGRPASFRTFPGGFWDLVLIAITGRRLGTVAGVLIDTLGQILDCLLEGIDLR